MSILARERPGVYSNYDASGVVWNPRGGKAVGIAASGDGESLRVYPVNREQDAKIIFGPQSTLTRMCTAALQNGAAQVLAVPVSGQAPDYAAAFAALETEEVCLVACGSLSPADHTFLKESVERASSQNRERVGIACSPEGDPEAWAQAINSERMVLLAQAPADPDVPACVLAAALAGCIAGLSDPSASLNGTVLHGIPLLARRLSEEEVDHLIRLGVTPLENAAGQVEAIRVVTSKTVTDGTPDASLRELSTVLTADHVLQVVRDCLQQLLPGARNSARTRTALATQAAVVLEENRRAGFIESYQRPFAYAAEDDPAACVVEISFHILRGLNQIVVAAHMQV